MIYTKLKDLIKPNCTIIEIGAHTGTDTIKLVRTLNPLMYLAIEPDKRNYEQLMTRRNNEGLYQVRVIPHAIGNSNSYRPFYYSGGSRGGRTHTDSNSLLKPKEHSKRPTHITFMEGMVECKTLDNVVSDWGLAHIDLIWMDVQGAELEVIEGGREALKETKYIYTECQEERYHGQPGLKGIMSALPDWQVVLMNGDNVLLENKGR